jgi:hypothetical protein
LPTRRTVKEDGAIWQTNDKNNELERNKGNTEKERVSNYQAGVKR